MEIAHGTIKVDLDDKEAIAGLRKLDAEFDRAMSKIEREHAVATVEADIKPLEDSLANAKRKLKQLEGQKAEAKITGDNTDFDKKIALARLEIKRIDGEKATVELDVKGEEKVKAAQEAVRARQAAIAKEAEAALRRQQRLEDQASKDNIARVNRDARVRTALHKQQLAEMRQAESEAHRINNAMASESAAEAKARLQRVNNEARVTKSLNDQKIREMRAAESEAHSIDLARGRAHLDEVRRASKIADLQRQYAKAVQDVERQKGRRAPLGREARVELNLDRNAAVEKMRLLKAELNAIGAHPPVGIEVDVDRNGKAAGAIGRMADAIATTTVRVGPFTTTIIGLVRAMGLIGPIVVGIIGQIGALGAVLGSGIVGALGALSAGAVGFVGAAGGIFAVVKPIVKQFQEAKKATDAYNTAVLKYGANSKQAKKAQEQLNSVISQLDPQVRQQLRTLPQLTSEWKKLTAPATAQVWQVIGDGIRTASSLLPLFARNTNAATAAVSRGLRDMMGGLRSQEGQSIIGNLLGGFTDSIPNILHGLGQLGAAAGRFLQPFAALLPGLTRGFDQWATALSNASKNAGHMNDIADRTIAAMRSIGHVTTAAARVLASLVKAGTGPGTGMLDTWATGLNKLADSMASVQGQSGLTSFFDRSIATANKLWQAVSPLAQIFFEWTTALAPFTDAGLVLVRMFGQLTHAIASIGALKGVLQGVFAVYLLNSFGKRIQEAAYGVRELTRSLIGLRTVQTATAGEGALAGALSKGSPLAASAAAGAAGAGGTRALGREAAVAERQVGALRAAATAVVPAIAGMGAIAGGAATIGIGALAAAALYGGYKLITMKDATDHLHDSIENVGRSTKELSNSTNAYADSVTAAGAAQKQYTSLSDAVAASKKRLNDLDANGKRNTKSFADETAHLTDLLGRRQQTEGQLKRLTDQNVGLSARVQIATRNRSDAQDTLNKALEAQQKVEDQPVGPRGDPLRQEKLAAAAKDVADARKALKTQTDAANVAENTMAAAGLNVQRVLKGMIPLAGEAAQTLGKLARTRPTTALKIATKFEDPKDASRVAAQAQKSLGAGVKIKTVMQIVADSRSADTAVARLKAVRLDPKTLGILQRGGDAAVAMLETIKGKKLTPKQQKIAQSGGAGVLAIVGRILGIHIPNKNFTVSARDNASGVIRSIQGVLAGLANKTITVTTIHNDIATKLAHPKAAGHSPAGSLSALVGEGGGPEFLANRKTGVVSLTDGPLLTKLTKDDYVIPTEPKYHARGRALASQFGRDTGTDGNLAEWMKMFGVKGYKIGKAPPRTATKTAQQRHASKEYAKKDVRNPGAYTEINRVAQLQQAEADQSARISLAEGALKEPDSFIVKTGTDAEGNDIFAVDQGAVNKWSADLANIRSMYNSLVQILQDLAKAVQAAIHAVQKTITSSNHNIGVLNTQETHEKNVIKNAKGKDKATVKANANARLVWLKQEEERQKTIRSDAKDSQDDLNKETQFAGGVGTPGKPGQRILEAMQEADSYNTESQAVAAMASGQAESANPQPSTKPGATAGPFDAFNLKESALDAEAALTAIGQGTRTPQAIIADQIANNQSIINAAKGLLNDTDPSNDADAYSAIGQAAGAIQNLQGGLPNIPAETMTLSGARGDLFRSMGSNFAAIGPAAAGIMGPRPGLGALGANAAAQGGDGSTVINMVNNYQTQPADPHTWSKNVLFELAAAG